MMTSEHARLSLDGKTIWSEYPRQFKFLRSARNLMLHDYDLGQVEGSFEEVKKIVGFEFDHAFLTFKKES